MRVLFLGSPDSPLIRTISESGDEIVACERALCLEEIRDIGPEFIVSYGYRHIIGPDVLHAYEGLAINLHISLLPWNRGADPNFWSIVEGTPKGVTIHHLDPGIDTGDIIVQKEVELASTDTLASSYQRLHAVIHELFRENWSEIKAGRSPRCKQEGDGTFHRIRDKAQSGIDLPHGWDTPVSAIAGKLTCNHNK